MIRRLAKKKVITRCAVGLIVILFFGHLWLHLTNPYAAGSIVQQPYTTEVIDGKITVKKQFDLAVGASSAAQQLGYYKSGFLIVQNAYFGSQRAKSTTAGGIITDIHKKRFDPSKPYLISGDQFSVLYPRNLGVFYNDLLNPDTAHDQKDWENRQRIYLQSALYALEAFSKADTLTTTVVPISPRGVVLTEVHPGSVPSDTLYGILYALQALRDTSKYSQDTYPLQAVEAVEDILQTRRSDLARLVDIYLDQVRDPHSGLVQRSAHLAAARDGVIRQSSFYDNVVLWKTLQLASALGIKDISSQELDDLKNNIRQTFWDERAGHFRDSIQNNTAANYSSDWLIALPTGFLDPALEADRLLLERMVTYIDKHGIAKPFPIKYAVTSQNLHRPWAVRTFVPDYGGESIWSYWGAQYITLLGQLYKHTQKPPYDQAARTAIETYKHKIEQYQGFPETFTPQGDFLQNVVYKSIRQTGWVVQFETAVAVTDPQLLTGQEEKRLHHPACSLKLLCGAKAQGELQ